MAPRTESKPRADSVIDTVSPPPPPPPVRRMVHLKTKEECRLSNDTVQVWTVELPSKHAEGILKIVKENVDGHDSIDLQHLRRFAKSRYLPAHVLGKPDKVKELHSVPRHWNVILSPLQAPSTTAWEWSTPLKSRSNPQALTLHLLICPTNLIALLDLYDLLLQHPPFCSSAESWAYPLEIKEVTVPKMSPTSPAQADEWSAEYWPTFYRKTNPFGAHPSTISRAEEEMQNSIDGSMTVDEAMTLARRAAHETQSRGFGQGPGAVIVERFEGHTEVVAVAGDARFKHSPRGPNFDETQAAGCSGNVMSHAVMRAVGMVGRKRLRVASQPVSSRAARAERNFASCGLEHDERARDDFFLDLPITPLEQHYFVNDNIRPDGYLCLRLEVFLTHEPCVMCSMALVHSRVGKVVFAKRMPDTGGLTAELASNDSGPVGLGYGLCWRKELNWQFMCWEYPDDKVDEEDSGIRWPQEAASTSIGAIKVNGNTDAHETRVDTPMRNDALAHRHKHQHQHLPSSDPLPSPSPLPAHTTTLTADKSTTSSAEHQANVSSSARLHV